jgi:hypothetical protein
MELGGGVVRCTFVLAFHVGAPAVSSPLDWGLSAFSVHGVVLDGGNSEGDLLIMCLGRSGIVSVLVLQMMGRRWQFFVEVTDEALDGSAGV